MSLLRYGLLVVAASSLGSILFSPACSSVAKSCTGNAQCPSGQVCSQGGCVAMQPLGSVPLGGSCSDDMECDSGACDTTGVCVYDPYAPGSEMSGQDCYEDADCADGGACDTSTDTCM